MLPLIIIGSGLGGYMLAKEWRKIDTSTPLVIITESDGSFYSKPLLSTALSQKKTPEQLVINDCQAMAAELNASIYSHATVTDIDPIANIVKFDQQQLSFSQLVLACGAQKIIPQLTGDSVHEIISVNNHGDYKHFYDWLKDKKKIAILGAGLVGCEFANDLLNTGYDVTLIAPETHPLATFLPAKAALGLQQALMNKGVDWRLGHLAIELNRHHHQYDLILSNNTQVIVDGVFSAIGLRPEIKLAQQAGITVNRGIVVDRWLRTNYPSIFALGDCAEVDGLLLMYVAPLLQCARALAKILNGGDQPVHYPNMPIVLKTPAFPLIFSLPKSDIIGEWHFEEEGHDMRALFYDQSGQLRGFILAGNKIRDKMSLAQQLPLVFSE